MSEDEAKLFKTCAIPFSSIETKFVCVIGDNYDHSKKNFKVTWGYGTIHVKLINLKLKS